MKKGNPVSLVSIALVALTLAIIVVSFRLYTPRGENRGSVKQPSNNIPNTYLSQPFKSYINKSSPLTTVYFDMVNEACTITAGKLKFKAFIPEIKGRNCRPENNAVVLDNGGYLLYVQELEDTIPKIMIYQTSSGAHVILEQTEPTNYYVLEKIDEDKFVVGIVINSAGTEAISAWQRYSRGETNNAEPVTQGEDTSDINERPATHLDAKDPNRKFIKQVYSIQWLFEEFPYNTIHGDRFSDAGRYMGVVE